MYYSLAVEEKKTTASSVKLIGRGSHTYLNTFSNLFIVAVTTHINTCYVLLLLLAAPM